MIEAMALDFIQTPPAIVQQARSKSRKRRLKRERRQALDDAERRQQQQPLEQHQPRRERPARIQYFTGALALGVIVLMEGPEGPYECQIIDQDPDGTWICEPSF